LRWPWCPPPAAKRFVGTGLSDTPPHKAIGMLGLVAFLLLSVASRWLKAERLVCSPRLPAASTLPRARPCARCRPELGCPCLPAACAHARCQGLWGDAIWLGSGLPKRRAWLRRARLWANPRSLSHDLVSRIYKLKLGTACTSMAGPVSLLLQAPGPGACNCAVPLRVLVRGRALVRRGPAGGRGRAWCTCRPGAAWTRDYALACQARPGRTLSVGLELQSACHHDKQRQK